MYFIRNVFRGAKARYQKIEKLKLVVVVAKRKLRTYFQGHKIFVKTSYHIRQVLKKPNLVRRMISWAVELFEYDVKYVSRGSIKS